MSERIYEDAYGLAMKCLKRCVQEQDDSPSGVEMLKNTLSAICKAEKLMDGGYSRDGGYDGGSSQRTMYMGNRYSRDGYSRDGYGGDYSRGMSDRPRDLLERMMREASNDREREALRKALETFER